VDHAWLFVHLAGVLGFLAGHGVSAAVGLKLRTERQRERVRALLDLSAGARGFTYGSLAVLLVGGVAAGVTGHWWGQGWIWAAVGLLVGLVVATFPIAVPYYRRVRGAVDAASDNELDALLGSPRSVVLAVLGTGVLLAILWLMVFKPF
jgi:hypothetical protein